MSKTRFVSLILVTAVVAATPAIARVSPPDLEGKRVNEAETTLRGSGYKQVRTETKDGDNWIYFRNHSNGFYPCIGLVTAGGRVATALSLGEEECHKSDGVGAAGAGVAIAALIGAAILESHDKHHQDDRHKSNGRDHSQFERGYQDGLHNGQFVNYDHNEAYADGYAAGSRERENNLRSNRYHYEASRRDGNHRADLAAACAHEADRYWGLRRGSTSTYDVRKTGNGMHTVKVAAGYQTGTCTVSGDGTVRSVMND